MLLTTIAHQGREWTVHLTVVPEGSQPAALEFAFRRTEEDGEETTCTWKVTGEALDALYEEGNQLSEALLREQLVLALAGERCADPVGAGMPAAELREREF